MHQAIESTIPGTKITYRSVNPFAKEKHFVYFFSDVPHLMFEYMHVCMYVCMHVCEYNVYIVYVHVYVWVFVCYSIDLIWVVSLVPIQGESQSVR